MAINETWHRKHPMPKHPSIDDRIEWHREHAQHCGCREIPKRIKDEMVRRSSRAA